MFKTIHLYLCIAKLNKLHQVQQFNKAWGFTGVILRELFSAICIGFWWLHDLSSEQFVKVKLFGKQRFWNVTIASGSPPCLLERAVEYGPDNSRLFPL